MASTAGKVVEIPNNGTAVTAAAAIDTIIEAAITATSLTAVQASVKNGVRLADGRVLLIFLY